MATGNVATIDPARHKSEELRGKVVAGTLNKLTPEDWDLLLTRAEARSFRYNDIVLKQGVVGAALYVVAEGEVRVERDNQGRIAQLARLGAGAVFGEMSLLDEFAASASVVADGKVTILYLDGSAVSALTAKDSGFAARFFHSLATALSRRLRATNELVGRMGAHG